MKTLTVRFFHDPSHGWYEIPRSILLHMGILSKITRFSYIDKPFSADANIYLEEDCDATLFFLTAQKLGYTVKVNEKDIYENTSRVRNMASF
jgi:hypothetical protein